MHVMAASHLITVITAIRWSDISGVLIPGNLSVSYVKALEDENPTLAHISFPEGWQSHKPSFLSQLVSKQARSHIQPTTMRYSTLFAALFLASTVLAGPHMIRNDDDDEDNDDINIFEHANERW